MIDNFWEILESVAEVTNIMLCYSLILQAKINTRNGRIFWVYLGIILLSCINIYCNIGINMTLLCMMYCMLLPTVLMEKNKIKWMLLYPCAFMMASIINIAASFLLAMILNMPQGEIASIPWIATVANMVFTIIFGIVFIYKRIKNSKSPRGLYWNNALYIAVTVGTIFFYLLIGMTAFVGMEHSVPVFQMNLLGFFMSGVCIVFFAFFLWLSSTIHYNEMYNRENDMLNLYIKEQEKHMGLIVEKDNDMRRFRHDIREHMWIISQYIQNGEYEEVQKYVDTIYGKFNESDLACYTNITSLDAIINHKKLIMKEKGIELKWNGSKGKIAERFEVYDLCTLFGNILNNAIEACEGLENAHKLVEVVFDIDKDRLYIKESNMTKNSVVLDGEGNPVSTKTDKYNHGYGYKNIRSVVKKYEGEINLSVVNCLFTVEIFL